MKLKKFNKNLKKEYSDTFEITKPAKEKFRFRLKYGWSFLRERFHFKLRYIWLLVAVLTLCFLIGEHIAVSVINHNIDKKEEAVLDLSGNTLSLIQSEKELNKKVKYREDYTKKESILTRIFSFQLIGCSSKSEDDGSDAPNAVDPSAPSFDASEDNAYHTNIQTDGIDEMDSAKCDGVYIYSIMSQLISSGSSEHIKKYGNQLSIYDLSGNLVVAKEVGGDKLYLYKNRIIVLGDIKTEIIEFDGLTLKEEYILNYGKLVDTRLAGNVLYIISATKRDSENIIYENLYYDGCINPTYFYSILRYDLDSKEEKKVQAFNTYSADLYMSNHHIFLASNNHFNGKTATFVSVFDYDLSPVGVVKAKGVLLNQFSMDEYQGYFRMVTTDSSQESERLNAISIFDLTTLERVGFLNEGIGIDRQTIRSVRFDKDICYVVTYLTQDPLYEIDCSNPTQPFIASQYEAPGYSGYLHTFEIMGKSYVLGIGYTDDRTPKLSVYTNDNGMVQIGSDLIIQSKQHYQEVYEKAWIYTMEDALSTAFLGNHKALFFYNDNEFLYIGAMLSVSEYTVFKIDITNTVMPISVYKEFKDLETKDSQTRGFLVNGKFYIPIYNEILIEEWN